MAFLKLSGTISETRRMVNKRGTGWLVTWEWNRSMQEEFPETRFWVTLGFMHSCYSTFILFNKSWKKKLPRNGNQVHHSTHLTTHIHNLTSIFTNSTYHGRIMQKHFRTSSFKSTYLPNYSTIFKTTTTTELSIRRPF